MYSFWSSSRRLTISAMVIAAYLAIIFFTAGISFGAYQIRIATALYALAYCFPFLVIPMGIANFFANLLFGGLGIIDMIGGSLVGMIVTFLLVQIKIRTLPIWLAFFPIVLVPALGVGLWLAPLLHIPYTAVVSSIAIGQIIPAGIGVFFIHTFIRYKYIIVKENI